MEYLGRIEVGVLYLRTSLAIVESFVQNEVIPFLGENKNTGASLAQG